MLRREFRSTFRDSANTSERLVRGAWWHAPGSGPPFPVSLSTDVAQDLKIGVGDRVDWTVQGLTVPTTVVAISHTSVAPERPGERVSGDAVLTSAAESRGDWEAVPESRDGTEFSARVDSSLNAQASPLLVKVRSSDARATLQLPGRAGSLPREEGVGRGLEPLRDAGSLSPSLPTGTGVQNATTAAFNQKTADARHRVSQADPGRRIDRTGETFAHVAAASREGNIGPAVRDLSHRARLVDLWHDSIATATTSRTMVYNRLEPSAIDVFLESGGSWHPRPNPNDHALGFIEPGSTKP